MEVSFYSKYVDFPEFENALQKYWVPSIDISNDQITFDLSDTAYIALPQLCYLFIWIERLLKDGKKVNLAFQKGDTTEKYQFKLFGLFRNYGFFSQLSRFKDQLEVVPNPNQFTKQTSRLDLLEAPIVHLSSFGTEDRLKAFLTSLDPVSMTTTSSVSQSEKQLLDRTGVRNIFLKELGQNVFDHSGGESALIAVCMKTRNQLGYSSTALPLRDFGKKSNASNYIQVAVADFGIGISAQLRKTFKDDADAHERLNPNSELSIIEYAFWKDTTSKPTRSIEEMLDDEEIAKEFIPPTGLYFVLRLVREQKGFLYVRSGSSIWTMDFSSGEGKIVSPSRWRGKSLLKGRLQKLPGNLVVVLVPVDQVRRNTQIQMLECHSVATKPEVTDYLDTARLSLTVENEKKLVANIISKIKSLSRKLQSNQAIILDFSNYEIATKYLCKMLVYCMYRQEANKYLIVCDISPRCELEIINEELHNAMLENEHLTPIIYFSSKKCENFLLGHIDCNKHDNLFQIDTKYLESTLSKFRKIEVVEEINQTYNSSVKILLPPPSEGYLKGYYELADLVLKPQSARRIAEILRGMLSEQEYALVLPTSSILDRLAKELCFILKMDTDRIFLQRGEAPPALGSLLAYGRKGQKILILADVLVTGKTIERISQVMLNPVIVATIVDGRREATRYLPNNVEKIVYITKHELKWYQDKPRTWKYEDIRLTDRITHKIIYDQRHLNSMIWESDKYIDTWSRIDGCVRSGHYSYGQTCYLYFFNTYVICDLYRDDIVEKIREDVDGILERRLMKSNGYPRANIMPAPKRNKVTYLVYPQGNDAAESICTDLTLYIGGEIIILPRVTSTESGTIYSSTPSVRDREKSGIVVFVDVAASTTNTLRHLLEFAGDLKADLLLVYIVINRICGDWPAFLDGIEVFRGVEVRIKSLVRADLPAHNTRECPLCERRRRFDGLISGFIPVNCQKILRSLAEELVPRPIKVMRKEEGGGTPEFLKKMAEQVRFRISLERETNRISLVESENLRKTAEKAFKCEELRSGILRALAQEMEVFVNNERYSSLFDQAFRKLLFDLSIHSLINKADSIYTQCDAVWVASHIGFEKFLETILNNKLSYDNDVVKQIIGSIFIFHSATNREKCIKVLESISFALSSDTPIPSRNQTTLVALREASFYFRFRPEQERFCTSPYKRALHNLDSIFNQPGRSHTDLQRAFGDLQRIVVPENLKNIVSTTYLGKGGFHKKMTETILPSLQRVMAVWPEEILCELHYLRDGYFVQDISDLDSLLRENYYLFKKGCLTEEIWREAKTRLDSVFHRLYRNFFHNDTSILKKQLKRTRCHLGTTIDKCLERINSRFTERGIRARSFGNGLQDSILMPCSTFEDLFMTILDNVVKYSIEDSSVVIVASKVEEYLVLRVESAPTRNHRPEIRQGHGLEKVREIVANYDGEFECGESEPANGGNVEIRITVPG